MKRFSELRSWLRPEFIRQQLQTSLTLYPALAVCLAFGLARALLFIDHRIPQDARAWYLFTGEPESARELLSTIASSLLTFTALVFFITILVLQLASSQFSSRVLRTFLEDIMTRLSMAVFVGSFVYAMVLLPEVRAGGPDGWQFVPGLSVFVAFVLVVVSVVVFVRYINHMAHSIRAVHVLYRVADETRQSIEEMYPEPVGVSPGEARGPPEEPPTMTCRQDRPAGVVTAIRYERLMKFACDADAVIAFSAQVGDFVPRGAPLFLVWSGNEQLSLDELRETVIIGKKRNPRQDPAFGFRQLVDIAERALSPGINDPTTAVQALDYIHDLLRLLAQRQFPSPTRVDSAGRVRLFLPRPDWNAYVRLALDEIRQYGAKSIQVSRRLRSLLEDLESVAPLERRAELDEQLKLLDEAAVSAFGGGPELRRARTPSVQGQGGE